LKYPRLTRDKKKSVKIKSYDVIEIIRLHQVERLSINKIAKIYNVLPPTISRNLDPEINEKRNKLTNTYLKKSYKEDEQFRNRIKKT